MSPARATVVIAIPNAFEAGQATEQAASSNPNVLIVARGHSDGGRDVTSSRSAPTW
jgi:voltage-gated potassium channel Kch